MKNYVVINENEYFKKRANGIYMYECLVDNKENKFFETEKDAREYMENYNLKKDIRNFDANLETLSLFKYDEIEEGIIGEIIDSKSHDIDDLKEIENIDIRY